MFGMFIGPEIPNTLLYGGLAVFAITLFFCYLHKRQAERFEREPQVRGEFFCLRFHIKERLDDSSLSDDELNELLRMARFADKRYRKFCGRLCDENSCESMILPVVRGKEKH